MSTSGIPGSLKRKLWRRSSIAVLLWATAATSAQSKVMWGSRMLWRCRPGLRSTPTPSRRLHGATFFAHSRQVDPSRLLRRRGGAAAVAGLCARGSGDTDGDKLEGKQRAGFASSALDKSSPGRSARAAPDWLNEDDDMSLDPDEGVFDDEEYFHAAPFDEEVAALLDDEPPAFPGTDESADPLRAFAKSRPMPSSASTETTLPQRVQSNPPAESQSVESSASDDLSAESGQDPIWSDPVPQPAATDKQERSVAALEKKLQALTDQITAQNNGKAFNVKSPKQVADVLFGPLPQTSDAPPPTRSTNKDVLEGMASAGNRMADLVLQHRNFSRQLRKEKERIQYRSRGYDPTNPLSLATKTTRTGNRTQTSAHGLAFDGQNVTMVQTEDPLLIVDASAFIFRAYYSMPPLHRADGMPVGAVLGFCNMLNRIVLDRAIQETALGTDRQPRIVLAFDSKDADTFRQTMYPQYKANRSPCPIDLEPQFDLVKNAAKAYGILRVEAPTFEADDVIATLATRAKDDGLDVCILSSDKDLMQLVTDSNEGPRIDMFDPMNMIRISPDVIHSKWGVSPDKLGDVLALAGDTSDNIPGVPGIGPKSAAKLINEFGSLEELLSKLDTVKRKGWREKLEEHQEAARLSRKLVELERSIPHEALVCSRKFESTTDIQMKPLDQERLLRFYDNTGLGDVKRRVTGRLRRNGLLLSEEERQKRSREGLESIFYDDNSDDEDY